MGRIHAEGGQHGEDLGLKVAGQILTLGLGQILEGLQQDPVAGQLGPQIPLKQGLLLPQFGPQVATDGVHLILGAKAIGGLAADLSPHLLQQPRHPHHKKLVQVGAIDGAELQPLQQGGALV